MGIKAVGGYAREVDTQGRERDIHKVQQLRINHQR